MPDGTWPLIADLGVLRLDGQKVMVIIEPPEDELMSEEPEDLSSSTCRQLTLYAPANWPSYAPAI